MTPTANGYVLSSGREVSANGGYIGIRENLDLSEGYDGGIDPTDGAEWNDEAKPWTPQECAELADGMIALWQQFKAKYSTDIAVFKEPR